METRHIMIAEDEATMRQSLEIILEGAGFKISAKSSGEEALRRIVALKDTHEAIDLLVTDIQMRDMDGLDLMDELKNKGLQIPTIVVTGYGDRSTLKRLLRRGCTDYLDKPFSPGDIVSKVHKVFESRFFAENALPTMRKERGSKNEDLTKRLQAYRQRLDELRRTEKPTYLEEMLIDVGPNGLPLDTVYHHRPHPDGNRDFLSVRKTEKGCNILMAKMTKPNADRALVLKAFMKENCECGDDGGLFFGVLNRHFMETGKDDRALIGLFISLNLENMTGSIVSADHSFPIQLRAALPIPIYLAADGCALGLQKNASFESRLFRIQAGDRFFLLGDRPEVHNRSREMGEKPSEQLGAILRRMVARERNLSLKKMATESWKEVLQTRNGKLREDLMLLSFEIPKEWESNRPLERQRGKEAE